MTVNFTAESVVVVDELLVVLVMPEFSSLEQAMIQIVTKTNADNFKKRVFINDNFGLFSG